MVLQICISFNALKNDVGKSDFLKVLFAQSNSYIIQTRKVWTPGKVCIMCEGNWRFHLFCLGALKHLLITIDREQSNSLDSSNSRSFRPIFLGRQFNFWEGSILRQLHGFTCNLQDLRYFFFAGKFSRLKKNNIYSKYVANVILRLKNNKTVILNTTH